MDAQLPRRTALQRAHRPLTNLPTVLPNRAAAAPSRADALGSYPRAVAPTPLALRGRHHRLGLSESRPAECRPASFIEPPSSSKGQFAVASQRAACQAVVEPGRGSPMREVFRVLRRGCTRDAPEPRIGAGFRVFDPVQGPYWAGPPRRRHGLQPTPGSSSGPQSTTSLFSTALTADGSRSRTSCWVGLKTRPQRFSGFLALSGRWQAKPGRPHVPARRPRALPSLHLAVPPHPIVIGPLLRTGIACTLGGA